MVGGMSSGQSGTRAPVMSERERVQTIRDGYAGQPIQGVRLSNQTTTPVTDWPGPAPV